MSPVSCKAISTSWIGLCAASFFLAEANGVTMPFVNTYLQEIGWRYDAIGAAVALEGAVSLLVTLPGGFLIDRMRERRALLAAVSLLVGVSIGLVPLLPASALCIGGLLIAGAVGKPLFGPLTNALTLQLAGHQRMDRAMGINQAWNHAGNIAAALLAIILVQSLPVATVFFATMIASVLAAGSVFLIRSNELDESMDGPTRLEAAVQFRELFSDGRVMILLISAALFHLANAPVMPLVAQKIRFVGGSHSQVAAVVLAAQMVMVPTAILAGLCGPRFGHKRVLAVGFIVLPIRILLYSLTNDPWSLVLLQGLDGIGVGIFGVTAVAMCADVTRESGHFNALCGALATAGGLGAVIGPLIGGVIVQQFGFSAAFLGFAAIASAAAVLFVGGMPADRAEKRIADELILSFDGTASAE